MKRAILVTTSTAVGVAAVLSYQPNSEVAATMLDLTGATMGVESGAPQDAVAATAEPTATTTPTASAKPTATATASKQSSPKATATPTPQSTTTSVAPTAKPTPTTTANSATRTLTGDAYGAMHGYKNYGQVVVTVTLSGDQMTDISFSQNPSARNEPYISAVRQYLIPAVLQAQSASVGYVSGATATSEAFAKSLQSALNKG